MKTYLILASALTILALTACSKDDEGNAPTGIDDGANTAYVSIKVQKQQGTRGSGEEDGNPTEDALSTLYLMTFDNSKNLLKIPGTTNTYHIKLNNPDKTTSEAVKVSSATNYLFVVANPGPAFTSAITGFIGGSNYSTVNRAIASVTTSEVIHSAQDVGFAMVPMGEEGANSGAVVTEGLIEASTYIKETKAEAEQAGNRLPVFIERLASKLKLKMANGTSLEVSPKDDGASFTLKGWTMDVLNTTFFPFAEKTMLTGHMAGKYNFSFYTKDPNYTPATDGEGMQFVNVNATTYEPELLAPYTTWLDDEDITYCIENTMDAPLQRFGNATRLVIQGTYYPKAGWTGDWFSFAGTNYETLVALQTDYNQASPGSDLKNAGDDMYTKIKAHLTTQITATGFADLVQSDLDKVLVNGGELIKTDKDTPCIRWYHKGINHYYYSIIHNNEATGDMAYSKYGVVRNNYYSLTLNSVGGAGTPWYPSIDEPGPGDPDKPDPLDPEAGYIGIVVSVQPWIIWENNIGI